MNLELTDEQTRVLFAAARDYAEGCARILEANGRPGRPEYTPNTRDRAAYELGVASGLLRTLNAALPDDPDEEPTTGVGVVLAELPRRGLVPLVDGPLPEGTYALVLYHDNTFDEIHVPTAWGADFARSVVGPFDLFTLPDREHVGAVFEHSVATLATQRNDLAWLCHGAGPNLFGTAVIWNDRPVPIDPYLVAMVRLSAGLLQSGMPRATAWEMVAKPYFELRR